FNSAHIMNMKIPFSKDEIDAAQLAAVRENNLPSAYLRPMVCFGSEGMGLRAANLKVHVMVAAWEWCAYLGPYAIEKGIKVRTSSYTRHYVNSMLALNEALSVGCDEALLLDPEGYVAEGSGENIFVIKDGILYTPELTSCLDGITRKTLIQLAEENGLKVKEKRITRDEVYIADEAFFTGTAAEVTPIRELDGRLIGSGSRGPITEKLQKQYFDMVLGKLPKYNHWLTPVARSSRRFSADEQ